MNPLDEYIPMVEEMKQMMQGDTEAVEKFVESDTFEKLMKALISKTEPLQKMPNSF